MIEHSNLIISGLLYTFGCDVKLWIILLLQAIASIVALLSLHCESIFRAVPLIILRVEWTDNFFPLGRGVFLKCFPKG